MKLRMIVSIACILLVPSCTLKPEKGNVENVIQQGLWKVGQFINGSVDETADFEGYQFNFHVNHYLVASGNNHTMTGSWEVKDDNGSIQIKIHFNSDNDHLEFTQIEEEWEVMELTGTLVKTTADGGEKFLDLERL